MPWCSAACTPLAMAWAGELCARARAHVCVRVRVCVCVCVTQPAAQECLPAAVATACWIRAVPELLAAHGALSELNLSCACRYAPAVEGPMFHFHQLLHAAYLGQH